MANSTRYVNKLNQSSLNVSISTTTLIPSQNTFENISEVAGSNPVSGFEEILKYIKNLDVYAQITIIAITTVIVLIIIIIIIICCKSSGRSETRKKKKDDLIDLKKNQILGFTPKEMDYPNYLELNYSTHIGHLKIGDHFKFPFLRMRMAFVPSTCILTLVINDCQNLNVFKTLRLMITIVDLKYESSNFDNVEIPTINDTFFIKINQYYKYLNKRICIKVNFKHVFENKTNPTCLTQHFDIFFLSKKIAFHNMRNY
ncbi:hypothetical protein RF11_05490 [Thelohanellus kitauei]|uniref:Uncharacterized protein n=1 Tax=Thelohanellus kitauei TaxID=669202 RepID=A0A0C2MJZ0_THEKT|nr:hypothetical protein RF11_05490 [Thelohanellus kitauei]